MGEKKRTKRSEETIRKERKRRVRIERRKVRNQVSSWKEKKEE